MVRRPTTESDDPLDQLTVRERRFVEAYLGDAGGVGVRAAEMAGFTGSTHALKGYASTLIRRPAVRTAIDSLMEQDPLIPGRIERLRFLGSVMRGEVHGERLNAEGDVVAIAPSISERQRACEKLGELAGDYRRAEKGDKDDELPPGLTVDELFDLAGIPRPAPRVPSPTKPEPN